MLVCQNEAYESTSFTPCDLAYFFLTFAHNKRYIGSSHVYSALAELYLVAITRDHVM